MQVGRFGLLSRSGLSLTVTRRCRLGIRDKYEPEYRQIVDALVTERKARGLTQGQVAQAMGVEQSRVSKYERLERRLDILDYVRYCRAIGMRPGALLDAH